MKENTLWSTQTTKENNVIEDKKFKTLFGRLHDAIKEDLADPVKTNTEEKIVQLGKEEFVLSINYGTGEVSIIDRRGRTLQK